MRQEKKRQTAAADAERIYDLIRSKLGDRQTNKGRSYVSLAIWKTDAIEGQIMCSLFKYHVDGCNYPYFKNHIGRMYTCVVKKQDDTYWNSFFSTLKKRTAADGIAFEVELECYTAKHLKIDIDTFQKGSFSCHFMKTGRSIRRRDPEPLITMCIICRYSG